MILIYRVELGAAIYSQATQIDRLQPEAVPFGKFLKAAFNDFIFFCLLWVCYLGVKIWAHRRMPRLAANTIIKIGEGFFATALLLLLAFVERAHYELLLQLDTGLTLDFVKITPTMVDGGDFFRMLTWQDVVFILAPALVFILACLFARTWRRSGKYVFILLLAVVLCAQMAGRQTLPSEIASNPVVYFLSDAIQDWRHELVRENEYYANFKDLPGDEQTNSIQLVDEAFVNPQFQQPAPRHEPALTADGKPWNILFFVLESTGADYVFDTSLGNPTPMPFLQKLTGEGLYLSNHFASADNSAKAALSLFTGLYPSTGSKNFAMEKNVVIPTLNRYLPPEYDYFLIHPTEPEFSFPQFLFLDNGLRNFYNMETLPPDRHAAPNHLARNEIDSIDFLMARLDSAREPFLGIYWSFIPHFPYSDYGSEFRILPGVTKRQAYYNDLRTLDTQLQRVYEHLVKTGLADRTLLIIVGDHGEAFGQHPQVWAHTFGFNSEMFRTPMLFWQPKLVSPQVIKFPTSHVDVTPTLLDILGFPYDESRFQGESVLRGTPRRKYIFTMDAHGEYISAISPQMNKVVVGFRRNYFAAFNLAKDPAEKFPLEENRFWPQAEAIIKFRNYQSRMIGNYNQAILAGHPFPPKNHLHSGEEKEPAPS
jgi:phosphoglycerol transferase MdoB-like AlkP superfamily enzyme